MRYLLHSCHSIPLLLFVVGIRALLWPLFNGGGVVPLLLVESRLEAAAILPHGDFALDPTLLPAGTVERVAANEIAKGAAVVADWMHRTVDPDVLFLSTPHGIALSNEFAIYLGSTASGSAEIGADLHNSSCHNYTVRLPTIALEPTLAKELVEQMHKAGQTNVTGVLVSPNDSEDMPLHWAEVIPLLLMSSRPGGITEQAAMKIATTIESQRKLVQHRPSFTTLDHRSAPPREQRRRHHMIWSHPLRRFTEAPNNMVPELLHLGSMLRKWLDRLPGRIAVLVSGDLSHTHTANGPYGYSNTSSMFDAHVGRWAARPCSPLGARALLREAKSLQNKAKSCGFTGFVLLHGILCGNDDDDGDGWTTRDDDESKQRGPSRSFRRPRNVARKEDHEIALEEKEDDDDPWTGTVTVNRNATYYGMLAAQFHRND